MCSFSGARHATERAEARRAEGARLPELRLSHDPVPRLRHRPARRQQASARGQAVGAHTAVAREQDGSRVQLRHGAARGLRRRGGAGRVQRPSGALRGRRVQRDDRPRGADRARGLVVRRPAPPREGADPSLVDVRVARRGHRHAEGRRARGVPLSERRGPDGALARRRATTSTSKSTTSYDFIVDAHFKDLADFEACREHPAYKEALALAVDATKYEWTARLTHKMASWLSTTADDARRLG